VQLSIPQHDLFTYELCKLISTATTCSLSYAFIVVSTHMRVVGEHTEVTMARPSDERSDATTEKVRRDSLQSPERNRSDADPERISRRAFEKFQERGGEHGHDQEDWFEAERELSQSRHGE
jgi:hypothetical protein